MLHKLQSKLYVVIPVLLSITMLTGCGETASATETTNIGYVTETTMSNTVEASGSVSPYQLATLTWGTSGTVSEVNVNTDDEVANQDILISLNSNSVPSEVTLAITELITAQEALEAAKNSNTALAEAEVALVTAQDAYYQALGYSYTLDKPVGSDDYNAILNADLITAKEALEKAEDYYEGFSEYADTDPLKVAARAALAEARIDVKEAQSIYNYYTNVPNTMDAATINAELALAEAQLEDAQRAYDLLKDGDNTDAIASAQAEVDAAQATVNDMYIIAPFDGEVAVLYNQPGDVVSEGDSAAIIVNRTKLYIDVSIDETSIANVAVGDTATITFDSLNDLTTTGKVTLINPVGTTTNGVVNYTVRVELDKTDPSILIGATASVVINVGEAGNVLFVPVTAVLTDDQGEYVMRIKSDGTTERVTVVSGSIYDETVVVTGDLAAGDKVQLYETISTSSDSTEEDSASQTIQLGTGGGEMPAGGGGEMPAGGGGQMPSGGGGGAPMP